MSLLLRLVARLRQLEPRHWTALGGSVVLHLAVMVGLRQEPPPLPETVSFEVDLKPPEELQAPRPRVKTETDRARQAKPKKIKVARKPNKKDKTKREPQTLEARFIEERKVPRNAPAVALPTLTEAPGVSEPQSLGRVEPVRAPAAKVAQAVQTLAASAADPVQPAMVSAGTTGAEPALAAATGQGTVAPDPAPGSELGLALAPSRVMAETVAQATPQAPGGGEASPGAEASTLPGGEAQGSQAGESGFSASTQPGSGQNLAAGAGAQAASASAAAAHAGGEPQGLRLTASGTLSSLPEFPQGRGGLAAGALAPAAGGAAPAEGDSPGRTLASSKAGGTPAIPLKEPKAVPGKGGGQGAAAVARASSPGAAKGAGPGVGRLAGSTPAGNSLGKVRAPAAGNSSRGGKSLALAPGEPGSGPQWAVLMVPVQTGMPVVYGQPQGRPAPQASRQVRSGPAGGDVSPGGARAADNRLAQAPGTGMSAVAPNSGKTAPAGSGGRTVAPVTGASAIADARPDTRGVGLSVVRPPDQRLVKAEDSKVDTLDVLAPSNYCPLPFHPQPDNRPPQAGEDQMELPSYSAQNPSFVYPLMANVYGVEGKLILRVEVQADGTPGKMLLKQSSGNGVLDRDAREQLSRWRFNPARKNGEAVTAWIDVPVIYRLPEGRK